MVSSGRPTLRTSPKKKNKSLPKLTNQSSSTPSSITPIDTKNLEPSNSRPEEDTENDEFSHGAIAGPSSPTRRRRRPSASRRRSSSITAAAALISSYSTRSEEDNTTTKTNVKVSKSKVKRKHSHSSKQADDNSEEDDDENDEFGGDATETIHGARKALGRGRASPYHMALVSLLFSLAQGMPLASQFKVYTHLMCRVYQLKVKPSMLSHLMLPPAPELPSDPVCQDVWVEDSTSTYAAAMATVGALVSLILLNRCSRLSEYFGRKPLLLATHILLAISTSVFRISVLLPTYVGVTVLYVAVMVMEASAGAPLKIAVQNYVVDTTTESSRAGALSFTDGFGQLGAFPSSTLGGWLAAATQQFFAPFYASIAVYVATTAYMLVFVPESKKRRHHTLIDDFERIGESEENGQKADQSGRTDETDNETDADTDGGVGTESYFSSADGAHTALRSAWWQKLIYKLNFLAPLAVFLPQKHLSESHRTSSVGGRDWRLFVLAVIVVLEESFQVFMVPVLLLYNTKVFKYDVVQNGYLVSLLQGVRALYLTVCFPWLVTKIRTWLQSRKKSQERDGEDETDALLQNASSSKESDTEERGKLDLVIMLLSYILATGSLSLMALTRSWSDQYEKNKDGDGAKYPPWVGVAIAIVGLQIGAGATSLRTALLVNAVSEQEDTREALRYREQHQSIRHTLRKPYGSTNVTERRTSYQSNVTIEGSVGGTENTEDSFHVHHDRHQSKALAANQILCTAVYAFVPLLTSSIFGVGLNTDRPELVWIFKAGMAGLSAVATFVLILLYGNNTRP